MLLQILSRVIICTIYINCVPVQKARNFTYTLVIVSTLYSININSLRFNMDAKIISNCVQQIIRSFREEYNQLFSVLLTRAS